MTWTVADKFKVKLGGNTFIDSPYLLAFKGKSVFNLFRSEGTGILGITFDLHDATGRKIAAIKENRIYPVDTKFYSVKYPSRDVFTLQDKASEQEVLSITQSPGDPEGELWVTTNLYLPNGALFRASPDAIELGSIEAGENTFEGCGIDVDDNGVFAVTAVVPRGGQKSIPSFTWVKPKRTP